MQSYQILILTLSNSIPFTIGSLIKYIAAFDRFPIPVALDDKKFITLKNISLWNSS